MNMVSHFFCHIFLPLQLVKVISAGDFEDWINETWQVLQNVHPKIYISFFAGNWLKLPQL